MEYDKDKVDEYTLALLYLVMWSDKNSGTRAWKGFDWQTMDRLCEKGYIDNPKNKNKSVYVFPEAAEKAKELFIKFFGTETK
ncbi:MAG: hypothetical protein EHM72_09960 [Calditrichaeota bacterium]|nr:MAG: hypothetical protein EHM72_09960 [Calditrichota bacterium]